MLKSTDGMLRLLLNVPPIEKKRAKVDCSIYTKVKFTFKRYFFEYYDTKNINKRINEQSTTINTVYSMYIWSA